MTWNWVRRNHAGGSREDQKDAKMCTRAEKTFREAWGELAPI